MIAFLQNGNAVIVATARGDQTPESVAVVDPLAAQPALMELDQARFEQAWSGEVLLIKRNYAIGDPDQPFSLRWFIPEILRQRSLFTDVMIAALALHAIALTIPIFFQIVVDKVLVHQSLSTLYVLGGGVFIAILFDAIIGSLSEAIFSCTPPPG